MIFVSTIGNAFIQSKSFIQKVNIKNTFNKDSSVKMEISFFTILPVLFVNRLFMILINSEGIYNIHIKNVLFAIRAHNNLNMSTSIIMNKLSNILKSPIFIVKSVHVWLQNLRMCS